MLLGFILGLVGGFLIATALFLKLMETELDEKQKLWRLEEDEAREARGEPIFLGEGTKRL